MNTTMFKNMSWKYLLVILIIISICLKFTALDHKVYWIDEVFTSLRISGYSEKEVSQKLFTGTLISPQDLQKYQYPNSEKSIFDTIKGLAENEPQQVPLYFIILRYWTQLLGNSISVIRSCSAFFSLLTIPAIYWLCRELFDSASVGWVAITLVATSPFHLLYAQEARSYSLWTLSIILSSFTLLRALRLQTKFSWFLYSLTSILGFYTFLYSVFVTLGQGIYVLIRENFKISKNIRLYFISLIFSILVFLPWIITIIKHWQALSKYTSWQSSKIQFLDLLNLLSRHLTRLFIDFDLGNSPNFISFWIYQIINILIIGLVLYSVYFLCKQTKSNSYLFIFSLIMTTGLVIIVLDLIQGKQTVIAARYFIPCYIGIQISVAYLLHEQVVNFIVKSKQKIWKFVTIGLISVSFLSCLNILQAETWWNKLGGYIPQIGRIINNSAQPLVINEGDFWLISLSHYLKPETKIMVVDIRNGIPDFPQGFTDYFLFQSSSELVDLLKTNTGYNLNNLANIDQSILLKLLPN